MMDARRIDIDDFFQRRVARQASIETEDVTDITQHLACPALVYWDKVFLLDDTSLVYLGPFTMTLRKIRRVIEEGEAKDVSPVIPKSHREITEEVAHDYTSMPDAIFVKLMGYRERIDSFFHSITHTYQVFRVEKAGPRFEEHRQNYLAEPCQMTRL